MPQKTDNETKLSKNLLYRIIWKDKFIFVLLVSGFFGFLFGLVSATTQDAVEAGQVIAGVVPYPQPTVWFQLIGSVWTLSNQICAIFLSLGVSEVTLNYCVSGVLGMVAFQALSLIVLAFSNSRLLSIASAFFVVMTNAFNFGVEYPVLIVFPSTWGILGLSLTLFIIAAIGNKKYKLGAFLIGLAPAIHGVFGACLWLIAAISLLCDFKQFRHHLKSIINYFIAGCVILISSFVFHKLTAPEVPHITEQAASEYLNAFLNFSGEHRKAIDFTSIGILLNLIGCAISLLWLDLFKQQLTENLRFIFRSFIFFAIAGLFFSLLTWLPQSSLPQLIVILMPQRVINFNILGFLALLIGLFGFHKKDYRISICLLIFLIILSVLGLGLVRNAEFISYCVVAVMIGASILLIFFKVVKKLKADPPAVNPKAAGFIKRAISILLIVYIILITLAIYPSNLQNIEKRVPDRTRQLFLHDVSMGEGILLIPMMSDYRDPIVSTQLITRRPILLNPDKIDILPYVLAVGPQLENMLKKVYGIDFRNTMPANFLEVNKKVWETRRSDQWQDIQEEFGVTEVIAYRGWRLQLPIKAQDYHYILYQIPPK